MLGHEIPQPSPQLATDPMGHYNTTVNSTFPAIHQRVALLQRFLQIMLPGAFFGVTNRLQSPGAAVSTTDTVGIQALFVII
jgi:hypothetical protein